MITTKANIQANRTSTKQNPNVPFLYRTRTFSGAKNNPTPEGKEKNRSVVEKNPRNFKKGISDEVKKAFFRVEKAYDRWFWAPNWCNCAADEVANANNDFWKVYYRGKE